MHSYLHKNFILVKSGCYIKTREDDELIFNLEETFDNLRKFKIKLNLKKCIFGVSSGKFTQEYGLPSWNGP
jgi:hypothetical protein